MTRRLLRLGSVGAEPDGSFRWQRYISDLGEVASPNPRTRQRAAPLHISTTHADSFVELSLVQAIRLSLYTRIFRAPMNRRYTRVPHGFSHEIF